MQKILFIFSLFVTVAMHAMSRVMSHSGSSGTGSWKYSFSFVGLFYSIISPVLIALASRDYPGQSGTVIGYLSTAAGGGAMGSAWLIGMFGRVDRISDRILVACRVYWDRGRAGLFWPEGLQAILDGRKNKWIT
ncbi:hypothetical protein [Ammoniphilus sp. YIM 78166]|uniref:hypothetical protein n=1 Tax=Ammoniphilus sp. YIM 78166 TaxID=1644106 RepID=UPI00106FF1F9|nr:hypothetical protein [Ammoniphilus sp. YIM 78166]